jgi:hypothetical protein
MLSSQIVIYLRHNPCSLHAYEEPIHDKDDQSELDAADCITSEDWLQLREIMHYLSLSTRRRFMFNPHQITTVNSMAHFTRS